MIAAILLLASAGAQATEPKAIDLICIGTASSDQSIGTISSLLAGESHVQRVGSEDSITFHIDPANTGEARLPKRIQSAHKEDREGWFRLIEVVRAPNEITGRVRLHSMYKPKFRIDRITGLVNLSGNLGDFSGRCEAYDPATVQKKF